jgi:hypothetical protein
VCQAGGAPRSAFGGGLPAAFSSEPAKLAALRKARAARPEAPKSEARSA